MIYFTGFNAVEEYKERGFIVKKSKYIFVIAIILVISWLAVSFFSQDKKTAEEFANRVYSFPLPPKTKVVKQGYDYGVSYGGGPWGNGGQPTVVVYQGLSSELSEKELVNYYKEIGSEIPSLKGIEIYLEGDEEIQRTFNGEKTWYEGDTLKNPSTKDNTDEPIKLIIQVRNIFDSAFGEFAR